jgi:hypothetical protein
VRGIEARWFEGNTDRAATSLGHSFGNDSEEPAPKHKANEGRAEDEEEVEDARQKEADEEASELKNMRFHSAVFLSQPRISWMSTSPVPASPNHLHDEDEQQQLIEDDKRPCFGRSKTEPSKGDVQDAQVAAADAWAEKQRAHQHQYREKASQPTRHKELWAIMREEKKKQYQQRQLELVHIKQRKPFDDWYKDRMLKLKMEEMKKEQQKEARKEHPYRATVVDFLIQRNQPGPEQQVATVGTMVLGDVAAKKFAKKFSVVKVAESTTSTMKPAGSKAAARLTTSAF